MNLSSLANHGMTPDIKQLEKLAQSAALYKRPEFAPLLVGWLEKALQDS